MTEIGKLEEAEIKRENRRNKVRVWVTYGAAAYLFIGSLLVIGVFFINKEVFSAAKEIFTMVLPVATGVVTYWFASRQPKRNDADTTPNDNENAKT